jgi:predicted nucleic acid-binding protein
VTRILLDTGPLVAWVDRTDRDHARCVQYLRDARDELVTTEAVLTEALHFLGAPSERKSCFALLRGLRVRFANLTAPGLARAEDLMRQYADLPMDYADASLVVAGEMMGIDFVLTLDDRDFRTYRLEGKRHFRLVLA